jgi:hypothetical protein
VFINNFATSADTFFKYLRIIFFNFKRNIRLHFTTDCNEFELYNPINE